MYLSLLKKCILNTFDETIIIGKNTKSLTMIGEKRFDNIRYLFEDVISNNIEGDLIETGVWKGGAVIYMNGINKHYNQTRKIFVADSFEGLPPPDPKYIYDANANFHNEKEYSISLDEVKNNFNKLDLLDDNVIFIKGFFKDTLFQYPFDKISILRLDGDMYQSTIEALEALYDKVSIGGYIIVDDYGWKRCGCSKAVDYFIEKNNIKADFIWIDDIGVYWKKTN
jgi:O-methyltransferase